MRSVFVLCLFAVALAAVVDASNYTWGMRQHNDRLLTREYAVASSKFARVVTVDVYYPNKNMTQRSIINHIQVIDQVPKGKGGYASFIRGGIGFNYTALHLKSQRGNGINFMIDIYGVN